MMCYRGRFSACLAMSCFVRLRCLALSFHGLTLPKHSMRARCSVLRFLVLRSLALPRHPSKAGISVLSCFVSSVLSCLPYVLCIPSRCRVSCIRVSNPCGYTRCRAKPSRAFEASASGISVLYSTVLFRLSCLVRVYLAMSIFFLKRPPQSDLVAALHLRCMCSSSSGMLLGRSCMKVLSSHLFGMLFL